MKTIKANKYSKKVLSWLQSKTATRHYIGAAVLDSVAICMFRNEQDIIELFLRHTSPLVDLIILIDNCSTDESRAIATATARELGNIVITDLPDRGYNQSQTMTEALRHVQSVVFADFVFFLDADEFLSAGSKSALLDAVAHLPATSVGLVPWKTYLPDPAVSETDCPDPLARMRLRRKHEDPQYYKAILRMAGGLDPLMSVEQGNHQILKANGKPLDTQVLQGLELSHFPIRSVEQALAKGVIGWEANIARDSFSTKRKTAFQWKRLNDIAATGAQLTPDALLFEAVNYAQTEKTGALADHVIAHAHGVALHRRYSDGNSAPAPQLIAESRRDELFMTAALALPDAPSGSETQTDVSNAFKGDWHWNHIFLDEPPLRFAIERFAPQSVLDLGCGNGLYPLLYSHLGVADVLGVDGLEPEATVLSPLQYTKADLQEAFDAGRSFDLVICLEVVEHINPDATDTLIDSIARHAQGHILFSMAEPGQPGNGHINCKSMSDVLALWAQRGWQPDLSATLGLRAISSMSWFRRNIVLLRHTGETDETQAARALRQIGSLAFGWYRQSPGHRVTAFCEPYPKLKSSYGIVLSK